MMTTITYIAPLDQAITRIAEKHPDWLEQFLEEDWPYADENFDVVTHFGWFQRWVERYYPGWTKETQAQIQREYYTLHPPTEDTSTLCEYIESGWGPTVFQAVDEMKGTPWYYAGVVLAQSDVVNCEFDLDPTEVMHTARQLDKKEQERRSQY